ncbi:carboxypeptidase regulatory-like domain-containing protein [Geobacter pickeringii]|uniref:Uncharacterized protein n=1 Tax=Geobacter pickeringii TaxID=345632 RepID=A0A0B5B716_9BACT|nr:carboxypeptidase regulatory-like domain-containing protein [Geobacter pickeringii]AJE02313.1 hypothetical protein GPICK_02020 [Geobacter pickeringii]
MVKGGSISGTVTDSLTGAGIPGVYVTAIDSNSGMWINGTVTDANGLYTISGLTSGDYKIQFSEYASGYLSKWFNNKAGMTCSDIVHVVQPEAKTGIDAALLKGGSISGKVTNLDTGTGLGSVMVFAEDTKTRRGYGTITLPDGSYSLKGLPNGSFKIRFSLWGYVSLWYSLPSDTDRPIPISITAPLELTGIDAAMTKGLSISGRVSDKSTGAGIEGVYVSAYGQVGALEANYAFTDAAGVYTLTGLKRGPYAVLFSSPGYVNEWYNSSRNRAKATSVLVAAAETTGIDASLEKGGSISGTVTDSTNGAGVRYAQVAAYDTLTGNLADITSTDFRGTYTLSGLPSGTYNVRFDGRWSAMGGYLSSWYKDARTRVDAIPLTVSAPNVLTGIDASLARGGSISGTIKINSCPSPEAVLVRAYDAITGEVVSSSWSWTSFNSNFVINGLPGGNYKIEFDTLDSGFIRQWYKDREDMVHADTIPVSGTENITAIDALLLPGGGSISGIVTDEENKGIAFHEVKLFNAFTQGLVGTSHTDQDGKYFLKGLNTGSYLVFFEGSDQFAGRWFNWKGKKKASVVTVKAPGALSGIDGVLSAASEKASDDDEANDSEDLGRYRKKKSRLVNSTLSHFH